MEESSTSSSWTSQSSFPSRQSCRLFACFVFGAATQFTLFFSSFGGRKPVSGESGSLLPPMSPAEQWSNSVPVPVPADPWNSPDAESAGPDYSVEANVSPSFAKTSVLNSEPLDVEKLEVATTKKRFKVNVVIISNNRLPPLRRLCSSLLASHDHERLEMSLTFNLEASSSHELVNFAERFEWGRGYKTVRKRILQGGLIRAVTEAWYPSASDEYGLFLEDDIEVSPFFTDWIVYAMDTYTADAHLDPRLVGISLYTPRVTETYLVNGSKPRFDGNRLSAELFKGDRYVPLLMQTPCSWGALYFPQHWRDFLSYLQTRITSETQFVIEGSRTNGWTASWKRFLFEYLWAKGCYLMYPNFKEQRSFSTNHMEGGIHIGTKENEEAGNKREDFVVPLFSQADVAYWENFVSRPKYSMAELPVLDLFNRHFNTEKGLRRELNEIEEEWTLLPPSVKSMPPPAHIYDFLMEGQTLWTTPAFKERLRTQTGFKEDDVIYQGIIRKDGDFVVYEQQVKKENKGFGKRVFDTAVDAFDTSKTSTLNFYNYSLTLRSDGMLVLYAHPFKGPPCSEKRCDTLHEEVYCLPGKSGKLCKGFGPSKYCADSARCKGEKRTKFLLWTSPQGEPKPKKTYVAEIDQNGALVVHWGTTACNIAAKDTLYRSSSHAKRPCGLYPSKRELRCKNHHSKTVQAKLSDKSSITILISTYDRFEILMKQIAYYSLSPSVSRIIVTWHNMHLTPPKSTRIGHVLIHFLAQKEDSLSNRFNPSWQIATDAALIIDDDMKVHLQDIDVL